MLLGTFTLQKLYGREADSLETVNEVFHRVLAPHPARAVIRAFELWLERKQEFPTPADIIGLIRRKGREPVPKEIYINACKKDGADRTPADWDNIARYEQENNPKVNDFPDELQEEITVTENIRLRGVIKGLKDEIKRLTEIIAKHRNEPPKPRPSDMSIDERTIQWMKDEGRSQADIEEFIQSRLPKTA